MRVLPLLLMAAAELFAADPYRNLRHAAIHEELVLADLRRPFPTDAELSQRLIDHDKEFEQLVATTKADKEVYASRLTSL